jgi:hypothetical protein
MSKFMPEHNFNPVFGPLFRATGQNNLRPPDSPCCEDCRMTALEEANRTTQPVLAANPLRNMDPMAAIYGIRFSGYSRQANPPHEEHDQCQRCARSPH